MTALSIISSSHIRLYPAVLCLLLLLFSTPAAAAPRLSASVHPERVRAGEPFLLQIDVRWQGEPGRYVLYPPKLELPEGVVRQGVRQYFLTEGAETVYRYEFSLRAEASGSLDLGEISLDYRDMSGEQGQEGEPVKEPGPAVTVLPGGVKGLFGQLLVPAGALLALGALLLWRRRRVGRAEASMPAAPPAPSTEALLEEARRALTNGQADRVWAILLELKPCLPADRDPLPSLEQLEAEWLRVRYGGVKGAQEELERLLRAVELLL